MMRAVRPVLAWPSARMIAASVIESRLEVASSKTSMGAFFSIARAIATRCFSPPESFNPRSPTCTYTYTALYVHFVH